MEIKLSDHFTYGRLFRFVIPSIVMMIFKLDGIWFSIVVAETVALIVTVIFFVTNKKKYGY